MIFGGAPAGYDFAIFNTVIPGLPAGLNLESGSFQREIAGLLQAAHPLCGIVHRGMSASHKDD